jgi:hypothetical protein
VEIEYDFEKRYRLLREVIEPAKASLYVGNVAGYNFHTKIHLYEEFQWR